MKKATFIVCLLVGGLLFIVPFARGQTKKVFRVGYLSAQDRATESPRADGIRLALRELGYTEGQNLFIEYRYTQRDADRASQVAAELVALKVDVIVVAAEIAGSRRR